MTFEDLLEIVSKSNAPVLRTDSRLVESGDIFIAIEGACLDGHIFIHEALGRQAGFIVAQKRIDCKNAELVVVEQTSLAVSILAQARFGCPAKKLTNLAVTGTNGKTTVAFLVRSIIQNSNQKCGLISTISYDTGSGSIPAELTTPDAITIADLQKQMLDAGTKYMVTEASSHALHQNRLSNINFKAAAFTNLSGDHLDYHQTQENYLQAKMLLFNNMSPSQTAVLNKACRYCEKIAENTNAQILYYAIDQPADLTAAIESIDITGSTFTLSYEGKEQRINTSLPGQFNISNCLAASGLALASGFSLSEIAAGIKALKAVPGRLDKIDWAGPFTVLIDYAHTDDALKNVLSTLKPLCKGNLTVVFGCGGDRDKSKRPRMARVAEQLADKVIVTTDNPRTEQAAEIIGEIAIGFEDPASESIFIEIDRERAIDFVIENAEQDDIVLIAGKGHEDYQIIGDKKIHFSDHETARKYLARRK